MIGRATARAGKLKARGSLRAGDTTITHHLRYASILVQHSPSAVASYIAATSSCIEPANSTAAAESSHFVTKYSTLRT